MKDYSQHQYLAAMDLAESSLENSAAPGLLSAASAGKNEPDDRYPGTYFRIPGIPTPGKTTWSLVK